MQFTTFTCRSHSPAGQTDSSRAGSAETEIVDELSSMTSATPHQSNFKTNDKHTHTITESQTHYDAKLLHSQTAELTQDFSCTT